MLDHSAERPTATQAFVHGGRVMVLRAARALAAGEELTVDYNEPVDRRREATETEAGSGAPKGKDSKGRGGGGGGRKWPTREEYLQQKGVLHCPGRPMPSSSSR